MTKKRYTIQVVDDEVAGVEVNGVKYQSAMEITDPIDQARVERMIAAADFRSGKPASGETSQLGRIILSVFLGVAALMLVIAITAGVFTSQKLAKELSVPGSVTRLNIQRDSEGTQIYYPEVSFDLPDHTNRTIQINEGSSPSAYEVGQQVTMLYDPQHPSQARIQSFGGTLGLWTVSIITGVLALAFISASFFARWVLKS